MFDSSMQNLDDNRKMLEGSFRVQDKIQLTGFDPDQTLITVLLSRFIRIFIYIVSLRGKIDHLTCAKAFLFHVSIHSLIRTSCTDS